MKPWIASRSLSSGAHARDQLARNEESGHFLDLDLVGIERQMA
jgi:hypothetical protein